MMSIIARLNEYRLNGNGMPLYFQIIYRRKKRTLGSPYRLPLDNFNKSRERVVDRPYRKIPKRKEINNYISIVRSELLQCVKFLQREGGNFEVDDILELYKEKRVRSFLLLYMRKLIQERELEGRTGTARAYHSTLNKLIAFMGDDKNFTFRDITTCWVNQFYSYLQMSGIAPNTIYFYIRILRTTYNRAVLEGVPGACLPSPFGTVVIAETETIKRAIDPRLITTISLVNLACHPKLEIARDFFFFSFYCRGMSFVDMAYLKKDSIMGDTLCYIRSKTGKPLKVKIIQPLRNLIQKYYNEGEYVLPILNPEKGSLYTQYRSALKRHNSRLRKLSVLLDLPVPLTSYVARHSWATMAKKTGVPVSVISEALGHSSEKITYTYLASIDSEVIDAANERVMCLLG